MRSKSEGLAILLAGLVISCGTRAPAQDDRSEHSNQAIVFIRDDNIWMMNTDGRQQRPLTRNGVGRFSVSAEGHIVFDRFNLGSRRMLRDANIYLLDASTGAVESFTDDGLSTDPIISSDGTTVIFQKYATTPLPDQGYIGEGSGVWKLDTSSRRMEQLAGYIPVPMDILRERSRIFQTRADDRRWLYDSELMMSPSGNLFAFSRTYETGGMLTYLVHLDSGRVSAPILLPQRYQPGILALDNNRLLDDDNAINYLFILYNIDDESEVIIDRDVFISKAAFSKEGHRIAFYTPEDLGGDGGLWVLDAETMQQDAWIDIPSGAGSVESIAWGQGGELLLLQIGEETWLANVSDRDIRRIATDARWPTWTDAPGF